jgi:molybdopterin-biosynthesis enzyme MoeA-like protein
MNANELADFVEISKPDDKTHQAIATMLRKQAEEIEYWKTMFEKAMREQEK